MLATIEGVTYLVDRGTKEYKELEDVIISRRLGFHWVHPSFKPKDLKFYTNRKG